MNDRDADGAPLRAGILQPLTVAVSRDARARDRCRRKAGVAVRNSPAVERSLVTRNDEPLWGERFVNARTRYGLIAEFKNSDRLASFQSLGLQTRELKVVVTLVPFQPVTASANAISQLPHNGVQSIPCKGS